MNRTAASLIQLTKPSIMLLVLATGATALIVEGSMLATPLRALVFLLGLFLTGGCANALNQYFERGIDAKMTRTCSRRPLPLGKLTDTQAVSFAVIIGCAGVLLLGFVFNWLTAVLSLGVILFYSLFYTLWLKPNTSNNIVIGGIAGAMAPIGAWSAATGSTALMPWLLFLIIFLWTPPHFWALALRFKDDYQKTGLPMLPNVKGDRNTLTQILVYSIALFGASLLPLAVDFGWIYMTTAVTMGTVFVAKTWRARRSNDPQQVWGVFKFSILYLFLLLFSLIVDAFV